MKKQLLWLSIVTMLMLYSLTTANEQPQIIIDQTNKKILIQSGDQRLDLETLKSQTGTTNTQPNTQPPTPALSAENNNTHSSNTATPPPSIPTQNTALFAELSNGSELEKALYRMYHNGLTKYDQLENYRPTDPLLREEASKIITKAYTALGYPTTSKNTACSFSDAKTFDPSLIESIENSCRYWLLKGSNGSFLAKKTLTKAEALTVLIRILEGKSSDESMSPRWTLSFIKAKAIFLTNEQDVNALNRPITREEIALLIYRFKTILLNNQLKSAAQDQINSVNQHPTTFLNTLSSGHNTQKPQTWTPPKENIDPTVIALLSGDNGSASTLSILNNPEITEAMHRMRENGLTNASAISSYAPFEALTREQAAKMFVQFAKLENFKALSSSTNSCNFSDLKYADPALKSSIEQVCQLWVMQGNNHLFSPKGLVPKSQFITMLIRLANGGQLEENTTPRWKNYFLKAKELWIINNDDALSFDTPLTRYEAALLFYRFHIKQKITNTLNTSQLKNELISSVKNHDGSYISWSTQGYAINIDTNLLKNQYFQWGFVEVLGQRYALKKTSMTTFDLGEESFVWYGDLFALSSDNKIWNLTLIVSNGNIIDGSIRFSSEKKHWKIIPDPSTTARYQLLQW